MGKNGMLKPRTGTSGGAQRKQRAPNLPVTRNLPGQRGLPFSSKETSHPVPETVCVVNSPGSGALQGDPCPPKIRHR